MGAGSTLLPCRDMGCDPSEAGAYMCLADIAAEWRVPYATCIAYACFKTLAGLVFGLVFGLVSELGAGTEKGPPVRRVLSPWTPWEN